MRRERMITLLEHGLDALGWVNVVTALLVGLAGWAAWRKTVASTSQEIYQRVAQAYKAEVEALQERMRLLEQENQRLHSLLETIKRSLARRGLRVTDEGQVERQGEKHAGGSHAGGER
jgi:cell division protein FtsB